MQRYDFDGLVTTTFSVDDERRTMRGLVAAWNTIGQHANGDKWKFAKGSIQFVAAKFVRLLEEHGMSFGRAIAAESTDDGLYMTFKVDEGPHGDRMLAEAKSGKRFGLSPGVEADEEDIHLDPDDPTVRVFSLANLVEVSQVKSPAFKDSRLITVTASREGEIMPDAPEQTAPAAPAEAPEQTDIITAQFAAFQAWQAQQGQPEVERPTVVNPTRPVAAASVNEPLPYRFSHEGGKYVFRTDAQYDFSTDLMNVLRAREEGRDFTGPLGRVNGLVSAAFADVETADVTALNPNRFRPDLWQPQMDYDTRLWDMVNAGSTDGTKFDVPKFNSSSGLVGPATEKVEPAGGSYVAELQTVTPTQVWGKVEITRQSWRAGGTPQLSGILWDQILREYYEDREAAVATFLNTLTAAVDLVLTGTPVTGGNENDQRTATDLEAAIADLQFVRGGNRFRAFAVHQALYRVLARVKDDAGRPLYPQINPQNANGTAESLFTMMNIAGTRAVGSYALGTPGTSATNSWLFDPAKVLGWASAPERMFWDFGATVQTANLPQLSFVTLGIYGDVAFANLDINGVRQVIFDPSV